MAFVPDVALVEQVNSRARGWRQGDAIPVDAVVWIANPESPLTEQAEEADGLGASCLLAEATGLVVVSQTCDIVRDCAERPFVLVAPVVSLTEPAAGEARRGSRPRFVPLPGLGDDRFADLDLVVTVEKSALVAAEPVRGLPDERSRRRFGDGVGRVFSRFAFPDDLSLSLRGLVARLRDKHDRNSPEGAALRELEQIRVTGVPSWGAQEIDVFLTFAPATREEAGEIMSDAEWDETVDRWLRRAEPFGVIRSVDGAMIPLDELTAREYLDSDALDLDYLSWAALDVDK